MISISKQVRNTSWDFPSTYKSRKSKADVHFQTSQNRNFQ